MIVRSRPYIICVWHLTNFCKDMCFLSFSHIFFYSFLSRAFLTAFCWFNLRFSFSISNSNFSFSREQGWFVRYLGIMFLTDFLLSNFDDDFLGFRLIMMGAVSYCWKKSWEICRWLKLVYPKFDLDVWLLMFLNILSFVFIWM